jgi:hypothetical protein
VIRVPLRVALLGAVAALVFGVLGAPLLLPRLIAGADSALAQAAPTDTPTPSPTPPATATTAATQTPIVVTATPLPATQTPYVIVQSPTPLPATSAPAATATPLPPGYGPDACEPNNTLVQPCAVPTETDIANLNFSDGSPDVFSLLLKASRIYTISARAQGGIDPAIAVYVAGQTDKPVASNDDAGPGDNSAVAQITTTSEAWYIVLVENKAPGDLRGKTYTLSARSAASASTPVNSSGGADADQSGIGDALENNYDVNHASRIVWGVPYDLSLLCPDPTPGACGGGDHDFILAPAKAGIPLVALTYDLGPGADTNVIIYKPDPSQTADGSGAIPGWKAIAGNDDVAPGYTLRSLVRITPDWTGEALLVISSSERANPPALPVALGPSGRYRLIAGPPEMKAVAAVLSAQGDVPAPPAASAGAGAGGTPASAPAAVPTAAAAPVEVIKEASATGIAEVAQPSADLYGAVPPQPGDKLASYAKGTQVKLLGQSYRGWVKVQPAGAVMLGWMWGPSLSAVEVAGGLSGTLATGAASGTAAPGTPAAGATATSRVTPGPIGPTPAVGNRAATIELLDPEPLPVDDVKRPVARALRIEVCTNAPKDPHACAQPLAGLRVEIRLAANQAVQVQGLTDAAGKVTLSTSVPPGTRLVLAVPAAGLAADIADNATDLPVRVPPTLGGSQ